MLIYTHTVSAVKAEPGSEGYSQSVFGSFTFFPEIV